MNSPDLFFTEPLASEFNRRETGTGFLRASNGGEVGCRFVLEQVPTGSIELRCLLDTVQSDVWRQRPPAKHWYSEHENLTFDLETGDGCHLENLQFHVGSGGITNNGHRQSHEFSLSQVDLRQTGQRATERPVAFAEFSLVNFEVDHGNASVRFAKMWRWEDGVVVLRLGDRECWLRAAQNAGEVIKQLEATKGTAVTAIIRLPLHSLEEWDDIERRVDHLCTVLTLISGNRVTWISARAMDSWGYDLWARWRDSITNPYTTKDMLNTLSTERVVIRAFTTSYLPIIERMMLHFDEAEQNWNIRAAVNTWHETVISDHFVEQRGLLIAACMEMLRTRFLMQGGRQTILDPKLFDTQKNAISRDLKKSLKDKFPPQEGWSDEQRQLHNQELSLMYGHVKNLNYFPFRQSLEQMAQQLGMMSLAPDDETNSISHRFSMQPSDLARADPQQSKDSIKCFVRIRDHLTHQGGFVTATDEITELSGNETMTQLQFIQRFAAAFLCSALGWTQPMPTALVLPE